MNTRAGRYGGTAIALHWLLAPALAGMLVLGWFMTSLPMSPRRLLLFNWHKWCGICVLALALLRLGWRLGHRPPPALPMAPAQARAAAAVHALLYVLFFAVPLSGWAYSSAAGFPVVLFGTLPLPDWVPASRELAARLKPLHQALTWALAALVLAHVGAALKHHFIDRDGLLSRMWPAR